MLTTLHSSHTAEALQRIVGAFPAEIQAGIAAQLADCLVGVVCQRLRYFPERNLRAPECEVLMGSQPVKAMVRQGQFFKLPTALETGAADGCWTFARYREWLERQDRLVRAIGRASAARAAGARAPRCSSNRRASRPAGRRAAAEVPSDPGSPQDGVLEIPSSDEDLARILDELERRGE